MSTVKEGKMCLSKFNLIKIGKLTFLAVVTVPSGGIVATVEADAAALSA